MLSFRSIGRAVYDRRNWPVIFMAGAVVFLGSQFFEALGLDSSVWVIASIVIMALAARPFVKTSASD